MPVWASSFVAVDGEDLALADAMLHNTACKVIHKDSYFPFLKFLEYFLPIFALFHVFMVIFILHASSVSSFCCCIESLSWDEPPRCVFS